MLLTLASTNVGNIAVKAIATSVIVTPVTGQMMSYQPYCPRQHPYPRYWTPMFVCPPKKSNTCELYMGRTKYVAFPNVVVALLETEVLVCINDTVITFSYVFEKVYR